jgi:hypothetical protein
MDLRAKRKHIVLRIAVFFLASTAFALSYTQSPLYTSNQNQYFLHGLAKAGFGYLNSDWLANTRDPTPVFSRIVEWTYRINRLEGMFYLYYALLMGIYLFSLLGIIRIIFPQTKTPLMTFTILAGLILIHSAGLRFVMSRLAGVNWTYILEDGVADQRLLGSVFEPSTFGVFLLLSIYLFLDKKNLLAGICAVFAATVHPTYLMSAGILTIIYLFMLYFESRRVQKPIVLGGVTLLAALPILGYVYSNFGSTPLETSFTAQQILVDFRIPHHADISWWFDGTAIVKLSIILAAIFLVRKTRLFPIVLVPFVLGLGLTIIQVVSDSPTLALLFPWRVTTWLVPISMAVLLTESIIFLFHRVNLMQRRTQGILITVGLAIILLAVSTGIVRTFLDFSRQENSPEQDVLAWIAENKSPSDRYLVPTKMQDFRLITGAPIFVDFKSIPYRDSDVLEWYQRVREADRFYKQENCSLIDSINADEEITNILLPAGEFQQACPHTLLKYEDPDYLVYALVDK